MKHPVHIIYIILIGMASCFWVGCSEKSNKKQHRTTYQYKYDDKAEFELVKAQAAQENDNHPNLTTSNNPTTINTACSEDSKIIKEKKNVIPQEYQKATPKNPDLLYKGEYTDPDDARDVNTGEQYGLGIESDITVEVYKNYISGDFLYAKYDRTTNSGTRVYVGTEGYSDIEIYVTKNYDITIYSTLTTFYGTSTSKRKLIKKGEKRVSANVPGGNSSPPQYHPSYTPEKPLPPSSTPQKRWRNVVRQEDCPHCLHGECSTCNGRGYYTDGLTGKTVDCPNCVNGKCSHCHGAGTITRTEQVYE